jgi:hypothetical protein
LKKLKAGEISPAASVAPPSSPVTSKPASQSQGGPASQVKWTNNASVQAEHRESRPSGNDALGDLGIEFGPSLPPQRDPARGGTKIGNVSFHSSNRRQGEQKNQPARNVSHSDAGGDRPKRKEVDLAELRKALEQSLAPKPKTSEEELKERVEAEKYEDKTSFPNAPENPPTK